MRSTLPLLLALSLGACDPGPGPTSPRDGAAEASADAPAPDVPTMDVSGADVSGVDVSATDVSPRDVSPRDDSPSDVPASCPAGTRRDGERCVDVDECLADNGGCGEVGVFRCTNREATAPLCAYDPTQDFTALTDAVRTINLGSSLASAIVVHGDAALPVVYDASHATFVAAARAGMGRVMEWGHEGLMESPRNTTDDRGRLVLNAVRWMTRGRAGAVVGIDGGRAELRDFLTANGFSVRSAGVAELATVQVWITGAGAARSPADAARIRDWVRAGGGLMMGGHAWYWGYSNTDPAENFPGNAVLHDLGLTITTDSDPQNNTAVPVRAPTDLEHAVRALERVREHTAGGRPLAMADQVTASAVVRRGVRVEPLGSVYMDRVRLLRAMLPDVVPTTARPVRPATQPIAALTVTIDTRIAQDTPPAELRAHPAASDFPGSVAADAPTVTATRMLDLSYAGRTGRLGGNSDRPVWRSTGLYVAPGARVTVSVPATATGAGLDVLVGSWTDDNFGTESWTRMPVVARSFPIRAAETEVACAFGGLLYVRVPPGAGLGVQPVTVRGAVAAPRYVHGQTTLAEWRTAQRALPAPYAELESAKLVLTVPASQVRALDDPSALMAFWDRVMDADAELAAIDLARPRAERIVFDRQIVAGYMHAGYPIMAFTPQGAEAVDLDALRAAGNWGFFHEIGHNHQFADWSWSGTGECTVNLWSAYAMQFATGLGPLAGHPAITPAERTSRTRAYVAAGRNWARDHSVWTCLETFYQLQEGFGWDLLRRLNREYMALAEGDRPRTEADRIQQWVIRSSRLAERNLAPFYAAWGFPLTDATRAAVAALPAWAEDPMR